MNDAARPAGLILVAHEVFRPIVHDEMNAALPEAYRSLPRTEVHLQAVKASLSDLASFDWVTARRAQTREFDTKVKPEIELHPSWRIQYFGAAPIPLAMAFGHEVSGWNAMDVYQLRHDEPTWGWRHTELSPEAAFKPLALSEDRITAIGDLIVRVSASHKVDPAETAAVIPTSLGEIDIELIKPHEDAFSSAKDLDALKQRFDEVIDWAHRYRPNAQIHVFAAVAVGAAVRIGTAVNPTLHPLVHTYQYSRLSDPHYIHAFSLQRMERPRRKLSADDAARAAAYRREFSTELTKIRSLADEVKGRTDDSRRTWYERLLPTLPSATFHGRMGKLASLFETPLPQSKIDEATAAAAGGFLFEPISRSWQLDDALLTTISERLPNSVDRQQAARLLLLHEGVHQASHALTEAVALEVRRFPKILEELDYQADTWSFVHDFALQTAGRSITSDEARESFIKAISVAIEVFWAFDAENDAGRIEIRRLNRYLIWYWQLLKIQACDSLAQILEVLAERPLIEIAGPRIETRDGRVFYSLDDASFRDPEIGLLVGQRMQRSGHAPGSRVKDILIGFRNRDSHQIRSAMKSISDQNPG